MKPDIEKYRPHVAHLDLSEEEKTELIHTVWAILRNGFDRALGDDPVERCLELKAARTDERTQ